jgi:hypothetical protein
VWSSHGQPRDKPGGCWRERIVAVAEYANPLAFDTRTRLLVVEFSAGVA